MASVSSTFTASGTPSASLFVKGGEKFRLTITNTWVATVRVEESNNGGTAWSVLDSFVANAAQDFDAKPYDRTIRLNCFAFTSGTVTYVFQNVSRPTARTKYSSIPIGHTAYGSVGTNTTPSATVSYLVELFVSDTFSATGAAVLNGTAAATDKYIFALYDTTGKLIANTAVAGVVATGTDAFQEIAFTGGPIALAPGRYILMVTTNGTTTRIRTIATATFVNVLAGSIAGVFATVPGVIAFPETFTADKGPIGYLYA